MCHWSLQVTKHDGPPTKYECVCCVWGCIVCRWGHPFLYLRPGVLPREARLMKLLSRVVVGIKGKYPNEKLSGWMFMVHATSTHAIFLEAL